MNRTIINLYTTLFSIGYKTNDFFQKKWELQNDGENSSFLPEMSLRAMPGGGHGRLVSSDRRAATNSVPESPRKEKSAADEFGSG